jgi:hypothetical protein
MGNNQSIIQKCNFEDIQNIQHKQNHILINTLSEKEQDCLIQGTIQHNNEESIINNLLQHKKNCSIFIYGKNCNDNTIYEKYKQLTELGFTNVFVYCGGLFEWLCLQDIYGEDEFPTTIKELDILKFKPNSYYNKLYITN